MVHIVVYQNPDLTSDVRVSEAGSISFPLIGAVKVGGLTTGQAEKRIADALKSGNFVKQPGSRSSSRRCAATRLRCSGR